MSLPSLSLSGIVNVEILFVCWIDDSARRRPVATWARTHDNDSRMVGTGGEDERQGLQEDRGGRLLGRERRERGRAGGGQGVAVGARHLVVRGQGDPRLRPRRQAGRVAGHPRPRLQARLRRTANRSAMTPYAVVARSGRSSATVNAPRMSVTKRMSDPVPSTRASGSSRLTSRARTRPRTVPPSRNASHTILIRHPRDPAAARRVTVTAATLSRST